MLQSKMEVPLAAVVISSTFSQWLVVHNLSAKYNLKVLSAYDEAFSFITSTPRIDVLITELGLGHSTMGGCNLVREFRKKFAYEPIFLLASENSNDHRLVVLKDLKNIQLLSSPLDLFFMEKYVVSAMVRAHKKSGVAK